MFFDRDAAARSATLLGASAKEASAARTATESVLTPEWRPVGQALAALGLGKSPPFLPTREHPLSSVIRISLSNLIPGRVRPKNRDIRERTLALTSRQVGTKQPDIGVLTLRAQEGRERFGVAGPAFDGRVRHLEGGIKEGRKNGLVESDEESDKRIVNFLIRADNEVLRKMGLSPHDRKSHHRPPDRVRLPWNCDPPEREPESNGLGCLVHVLPDSQFNFSA